jgi:hypothetical protein
VKRLGVTARRLALDLDALRRDGDEPDDIRAVEASRETRLAAQKEREAQCREREVRAALARWVERETAKATR